MWILHDFEIRRRFHVESEYFENDQEKGLSQLEVWLPKICKRVRTSVPYKC